MEGSPVRGHYRSGIAQLNHALNLQSLRTELVRLLSAEIPHVEFFWGAIEPSPDRPQIPSWVRAHLERYPGLYKKLDQGELVSVSSAVLVPVISDGVLHGAIGAVSPADGQSLTAENIETIRQVAHEAAPILSRIIEVEQLRRERLLLASQKASLEATIQIRSHLHSNVAHELRTPLAAIRGYARMILEGKSGSINETQREYLLVISENTSRLIDTVGWMTHIVDISEQQFEVAMFDLRDVWVECAKAHEKLFAEKSIRIDQQVPSDSFLIAGDRKKFAHGFDQLIAAVLHFAAGQCQLKVEFSRGRDREISFRLSTDGCSMPPGALGRTFDRSAGDFSTADADAVSLGAVHDVVAMHGGRMFVNSTPDKGKGSTILFTLPAVRLEVEGRLA